MNYIAIIMTTDRKRQRYYNANSQLILDVIAAFVSYRLAIA